MLFRLILCGALAALVGCEPAGESPETGVMPPAALGPNEELVPEAAAEDVDLQVLDYQGLQALIARQRGKIVVMDAWSTACPPCIAEFPNLVKLHRKYGEKIAPISLSFDSDGLAPVEEVKQPVLKFLQQQNATFDNVLGEDADALYEKLDLASVPAVFIYDADGKLRKRFDASTGEEFTYADVEAYLVELWAEPREDAAR